MKKLTFAFLLLLISTFTFAQPDAEVLSANEIVWAGVDFSKAKLNWPGRVY